MHPKEAGNSFRSIIARTRKTRTLLVILACMMPSASRAELFDITYLLRFDVVGFNDNQHSANAVATLPDGSVLVAGTVKKESGGDIALVKLLPGAGVDESFGVNGWAFVDVTDSDSATAIAIQSDGKIVLGGWAGRGNNSDFAVARLKPDGSRDESFGAEGVSIVPVAGNSRDYVNDLVLLPDGKILAVGGVRMAERDDRVAVVRLNADGSLDRAFGAKGVLVMRPTREAQTVSCKSLCGGASSVAVTPEGHYLIGAETPPDSKVSVWRSWVIKLHPTGNIDKSFGNAGKREVFRSEADSTGTTRVVLQSEGGIVVGGGSNVLTPGGQFQMTRLTPSGKIDRHFGSDGQVTTQIVSQTAETGMLTLKAYPDGKLLAAGAVDTHDGAGLQFVVARYLENGALDTGFAENGLLVGGYSPADGSDALFALSVTPTGGFAAAGWTQIASGTKGIRFGVARYEDTPKRGPAQTRMPVGPAAGLPIANTLSFGADMGESF